MQATPPPAGRQAYRSLRVRSLLAIRWLWFGVVVSAAALVVDILWLREAGSPDRTFDSMDSLGSLADTASLVQLATFVIGAIIFLVWFTRAYANLPVLGVERPRYKKGWAIGGWLIPIGNLWIPKQLANDVWRAGDLELRPGDGGWSSRPVSPLLHWWWALWLLAGAAGRVSANMLNDARTFDAFQNATIVDVVFQLIAVASAVAAISVIKSSTERQELRAGALRAALLIPA